MVFWAPIKESAKLAQKPIPKYGHARLIWSITLPNINIILIKSTLFDMYIVPLNYILFVQLIVWKLSNCLHEDQKTFKNALNGSYLKLSFLCKCITRKSIGPFYFSIFSYELSESKLMWIQSSVTQKSKMQSPY